MKSFLKTAVTTLVLSGVMIAQIPKTANCQMGIGGIFSTQCAMSCCKRAPMPKCPMIKAEAPRDLIASTSTTFVQTLKAVAHFAASLDRFIPTCAGLVSNTKNELYAYFRSSSPQSRAPPADIHLLNA